MSNLQLLLLPLLLPAVFAAEPPRVGSKAQDFTLMSLRGQQVSLYKELAKGPALLIVLRGFPGYQCPICNRQVREFVSKAGEFESHLTRVIMVYPGAAKDLPARAEEFAKDKSLPSNFEMLLDPDYTFTSQYGLRWDAKNETAYPSTFLLAPDGTVQFAKVSKSHGERTTAAEMLALLK
jgi:peroxiredoxin